ncbi:YitT family protein [Tetragenococcus koreensis]|uniref:YitT family membrane protein n=1 Tax=Tetragenococcus koreensis TaxID=290335 RepID=A0AAN4UAZ0_9ENTE|nr:YitT family protein [Tetragenococcus koreensis]MDN5831803.1 YitT family protein [Tetragenococcus halophilus]AYW46140.1 YitT family protein [Tetragenococcus koreensis]MCF1586000.1 YitT family protein [Tetragenococcus koreensis]MCF1615577.1 YitT family protein [Tetragenococcus koreensis]MCF1618044.1 YitT family protein [Tetragenococcus koreensis]
MRHSLKLFLQTDYVTRFSFSIVYALLASVALNFFYEPGNIYASGATGVAQIISTLFQQFLQVDFPIAWGLLLINLPLFILGWFKISRRFTIFTGITVVFTSIFMELIPTEVLTTDPIICAIFGGVLNGAGMGYAFKNGLSSGGLDFITIYIRKKTGREVGSLSIIFNGMIMVAAGILFGWQYALYSALAIFVSGKVIDVVYTKQKKMQVMIITRRPEVVIAALQKRLQRGITIINNAQGAYTKENETVLFTIVTRYEMPLLREAMNKSDGKAFVSIAENVQILGNFYEEEL